MLFPIPRTFCIYSQPEPPLVHVSMWPSEDSLEALSLCSWETDKWPSHILYPQCLWVLSWGWRDAGTKQSTGVGLGTLSLRTHSKPHAMNTLPLCFITLSKPKKKLLAPTFIFKEGGLNLAFKLQFAMKLWKCGLYAFFLIYHITKSD